MPAMDLIEKYCSSSKSEDPLELALTLMRSPKVKMHCPEHHFLVLTVLLTGYYKSKKTTKRKQPKLE